MTLGNDNGTDGQTDGQTDRVRRNMRPPPREEGRIKTSTLLTWRLADIHDVCATRNLQETQLSLTNGETHFCRCNGVADLLTTRPSPYVLPMLRLSRNAIPALLESMERLHTRRRSRRNARLAFRRGVPSWA